MNATPSQAATVYQKLDKEAKAKASAAFVSYHAALAAGDLELAEACFHRFTEASAILQTGGKP